MTYGECESRDEVHDGDSHDIVGSKETGGTEATLKKAGSPNELDKPHNAGSLSGKGHAVARPGGARLNSTAGYGAEVIVREYLNKINQGPRPSTGDRSGALFGIFGNVGCDLRIKGSNDGLVRCC
jgi:hypothetical protein